MEQNSIKPKVFADFSIAAILRKDDKCREDKSSWGTLRQPTTQTTRTSPVTTFVETTYHNYGSRLSTPCFLESISTSERSSHVEEDELISVCGDYSEDGDGDEISGIGESHEDSSSDSTFSWLTCTRFKPPKLPRPRRKSASKRNGRGPRIPFSSHQLSVLENTFSRTQYLSSDAISKLADSLNLTETRVKIWFQNRRARFRREKELPIPQDMNSSRVSSTPPNSSFQDQPSQHQTSTLSSCSSFRHLINDLNLMAASNISGVNTCRKSLFFNLDHPI